MKIVVIGAGVAGLGIAWRLLQEGCAVTILERAQPGTGASWAAAGMLAVTAELEDSAEPERALALRASALWPAFAAELEEASGRAVFLAADGALLLAADAAELEAMAARADGNLRLVGPEEARTLVPLLGPIVGGLWSPHEAHVDNRALTEALTVAVLEAGGVILPNEPCVSIEKRAGRAVGVLSPYRRYDADAVLVAAGAWSGLLHQIPIAPVKGEVIALAPPPGASLPGPVVWGEGVYCVPRPHWGNGGRLLVGATVEEAGFDTGLTEAGRTRLRRAAESLMPGLAAWDLADHWAGLRPKSPDGLPLLGPVAEGLFVASGQYRNGILFTPAIAREMADIMLGNAMPISDFDPRRFGA
jgi:glycine oxidase